MVHHLSLQDGGALGMHYLAIHQPAVSLSGLTIRDHLSAFKHHIKHPRKGPTAPFNQAPNTMPLIPPEPTLVHVTVCIEIPALTMHEPLQPLSIIPRTVRPDIRPLSLKHTPTRHLPRVLFAILKRDLGVALGLAIHPFTDKDRACGRDDVGPRTVLDIVVEMAVINITI